MIKFRSIIGFVILINFNITNSQNIVDDFELPSHTFIKSNKNLMNPTLSIFNNNGPELTIYHRNQWFDINDSPKTYLANLTLNKYQENTYGISLYQKTLGVLKSYGGVINYAKGISLSEQNILAVGFNIVAFNTGLNKDKIIIGEPDPLLEKYENTSLAMINPGISLQLSEFNIGVYANNLYDYNFKTKDMQTPFEEKTYSGHLMYSSQKSVASNIFENSSLTLFTGAKYKKNYDLEYTGRAMYNVPKAGWLQAGYNNIYGISFGGGITVSQMFALGYNYEKGVSDTTTSLGPTHEVFLTIMLNNEDKVARTVATKEEKKEEKEEKREEDLKRTLEQEEIQRFKRNVYSTEIVEENPSSRAKIESFLTLAEEEKISYLLLPEKSTGIKKGYYIIANVYDVKARAESKLSDLKQLGLYKSGIFKTAVGGLNYVFIERFDNIKEAKKAYQSNYNNKYNEIMWILPIL